MECGVQYGCNKSQLMTRPEAILSERRLGPPALSTIDAIAQSLAIGPVFSAIFLAALVARAAGSAAPLATLIGAIGAICVGWVIVLFAQRFSGAGAIYDYVRRSTNPTLGLFAAGIYFIGTLFLGGAGILLAIGAVASSFFADLGLVLPWWMWAGAAALAVFIVNHLGIRAATRTQLILTLIGVMPLLVLALAIMIKGGARGHTLEVFNPYSSHTENLFRGVLFAITLFMGFEASASLGEETANPKRAIPVAVIGTVLISTLFYLLIVYASAIGFGVDKIADWGSDASPLSTLARRYVGGWLAPWVNVALLVDMLAVASAFTATGARGWFSLARHGLLPSALAKVSDYKTPLGGNITVSANAVALIAITAILFPRMDPMTMFDVTVLWGSILIDVIYVMLALVAVQLIPVDGRSWWQWLALAGAVFTPLLAIYGSVVPFPPYPVDIAVYGSVASIGLAMVWTLALRMSAAHRLEAAMIGAGDD
jgi:amino acid transporter